MWVRLSVLHKVAANRKMSRRHKFSSLGFLKHVFLIPTSPSLPLPLPAWKIHTLAHTENLTVSWSDPATRSNMGQHLAMKKAIKLRENNCSRLFVKNWQSFLSEGQEVTVFNTAVAAASLMVHLGPSPHRVPGSQFRAGSSHHHFVLDIAPTRWFLGFSPPLGCPWGYSSAAACGT